MKKKLAQLADENLLRSPLEVESAFGAKLTIKGKPVTCFCSNDYLGLAGDAQVKQAVCDAVQKWGLGASASRLISGTQSVHRDLERAIASLKKTDDALLTSTGWVANQAAISALTGPGDLILSDKLNHASIIEAAQSSKARLRSYHHRDMTRLESLLKKHRAEHDRCLIVTDSLFSMDGDFAPLAELVELKNRYNARLMIDDAHAFGVFGKTGAGAGEYFELSDQIDLTVGTLSKAVGSVGGFVASAKPVIDLMRSTAKSYIYTTALPACVCAGSLKSLEIIRTDPTRREHLHMLANWLCDKLKSAGLDILDTQSQIIPVVVGRTEDALRISAQLLEAGFLVPAIRPPTVPKGSSRLRIGLSASHTIEDVRALFDAISANA